MARRLGRQIGDRRDNFSRQSFFLLAMATKTVAAWSAVVHNLGKPKHHFIPQFVLSNNLFQCWQIKDI